jgi:hypothetical protein
MVTGLSLTSNSRLQAGSLDNRRLWWPSCTRKVSSHSQRIEPRLLDLFYGTYTPISSAICLSRFTLF